MHSLKFCPDEHQRQSQTGNLSGSEWSSRLSDGIQADAKKTEELKSMLIAMQDKISSKFNDGESDYCKDVLILNHEVGRTETICNNIFYFVFLKYLQKNHCLK